MPRIREVTIQFLVDKDAEYNTVLDTRIVAIYLDDERLVGPKGVDRMYFPIDLAAIGHHVAALIDDDAQFLKMSE